MGVADRGYVLFMVCLYVRLLIRTTPKLLVDDVIQNFWWGKAWGQETIGYISGVIYVAII